jgi:hypothetical protein
MRQAETAHVYRETNGASHSLFRCELFLHDTHFVDRHERRTAAADRETANFPPFEILERRFGRLDRHSTARGGRLGRLTGMGANRQLDAGSTRRRLNVDRR